VLSLHATRLATHATQKQIDYLDILFIDCRFKSMVERNCYLSREFGRDIHHLDELSVQEASRCIDMLREMKEEKWEEEARAQGYDVGEEYRK